MIGRWILAAMALMAAPAMAAPDLQPGETLLQVAAEGEARIRPDAAFLSVGVVSTGNTAAEATAGNARTMTAVIAAIRGAGVDPRYVLTQQISVQPRFARSAIGVYDEQPQITGYVARNSVSVTVVKLAIAPDVIAAAFAAGANSVSGPRLETEDPLAGHAAARADAIRNAAAQAADYAAGLGMKVGRILRISENRGTIEPLDYVTVTGSALRAPGAPPPPPPPPPVAGGELKRQVRLAIDYTLVPR